MHPNDYADWLRTNADLDPKKEIPSEEALDATATALSIARERGDAATVDILTTKLAQGTQRTDWTPAELGEDADAVNKAAGDFNIALDAVRTRFGIDPLPPVNPTPPEKKPQAPEPPPAKEPAAPEPQAEAPPSGSPRNYEAEWETEKGKPFEPIEKFSYDYGDKLDSPQRRRAKDEGVFIPTDYPSVPTSEEDLKREIDKKIAYREHKPSKFTNRNRFDPEKDRTMEAKVFGAIMSYEGSPYRWDQLRKTGATDEQLTQIIKDEIGQGASSRYGGSQHNGLKVTEDSNGEKGFKPRTVKGKELVAMVRDLMKIPLPAEDDTYDKGTLEDQINSADSLDQLDEVMDAARKGDAAEFKKIESLADRKQQEFADKNENYVLTSYETVKSQLQKAIDKLPEGLVVSISTSSWTGELTMHWSIPVKKSKKYPSGFRQTTYGHIGHPVYSQKDRIIESFGRKWQKGEQITTDTPPAEPEAKAGPTLADGTPLQDGNEWFPEKLGQLTLSFPGFNGHVRTEQLSDGQWISVGNVNHNGDMSFSAPLTTDKTYPTEEAATTASFERMIRDTEIVKDINHSRKDFTPEKYDKIIAWAKGEIAKLNPEAEPEAEAPATPTIDVAAAVKAAEAGSPLLKVKVGTMDAAGAFTKLTAKREAGKTLTPKEEVKLAEATQALTQHIATTKPPWKMTLREFQDNPVGVMIGTRQAYYSGVGGSEAKGINQRIDRAHRNIVIRAYKAGEKVPLEAAQNYPDLMERLEAERPPEEVLAFFRKKAEAAREKADTLQARWDEHGEMGPVWANVTNAERWAKKQEAKVAELEAKKAPEAEPKKPVNESPMDEDRRIAVKPDTFNTWKEIEDWVKTKSDDFLLNALAAQSDAIIRRMQGESDGSLNPLDQRSAALNRLNTGMVFMEVIRRGLKIPKSEMLTRYTGVAAKPEELPAIEAETKSAEAPVIPSAIEVEVETEAEPQSIEEQAKGLEKGSRVELTFKDGEVHHGIVNIIAGIVHLNTNSGGVFMLDPISSESALPNLEKIEVIRSAQEEIEFKDEKKFGELAYAKQPTTRDEYEATLWDLIAQSVKVRSKNNDKYDPASSLRSMQIDAQFARLADQIELAKTKRRYMDKNWYHAVRGEPLSNMKIELAGQLVSAEFDPPKPSDFEPNSIERRKKSPKPLTAYLSKELLKDMLSGAQYKLRIAKAKHRKEKFQKLVEKHQASLEKGDYVEAQMEKRGLTSADVFAYTGPKETAPNRDWTTLTEAERPPPLDNDFTGYGAWRRKVAEMVLPKGTQIEREALVMELASAITKENQKPGIEPWQHHIIARNFASQLIVGDHQDVLDRAKVRALGDEYSQWHMGRMFDGGPISAAAYDAHHKGPLPEGFERKGDMIASKISPSAELNPAFTLAKHDANEMGAKIMDGSLIMFWDSKKEANKGIKRSGLRAEAFEAHEQEPGKWVMRTADTKDVIHIDSVSAQVRDEDILHDRLPGPLEALDDTGKPYSNAYDEINSETEQNIDNAKDPDTQSKTPQWVAANEETGKPGFIRKYTGPILTPEEAKVKLAQWKAQAWADGTNNQNSSKTVLSLFDRTGLMAKPWVDAGYNVVAFDIDPETLTYEMDIREMTAEFLIDSGIEDVDVVIAQPPCDDFSNAGQWAFTSDKRTEEQKAAKRERLKQNIQLVEHTLDAISWLKPAIWALENPKGTIGKHTNVGAPRLVFDPFMYGDPYTKRTNLFGNFDENLPQAVVIPTLGSKILNLSGTGKGKKERSVTPEAFAYAFYMANRDYGQKFADRVIARMEENDASKASDEKATKAADKKLARIIDSPARRRAHEILRSNDLDAISKVVGGKIQAPPIGMLKIIKGVMKSGKATNAQRDMAEKWKIAGFDSYQPKNAFGTDFNGKVAQELHGMLFTQDKEQTRLDDWAGLLGDKVSNDEAMRLVMDDLNHVAKGMPDKNHPMNPNREATPEEIARMETESSKPATPKQDAAFKEANEFDFGRDDKPVSELKVGDTVTIEGEEMQVEAVNEDGSVVLNDGAKFGRQVLESGDVVWEETAKEMTAEEVEPVAGWLVDQSEEKGYGSLDEFAATNREEFDRLAQERIETARREAAEASAGRGPKDRGGEKGGEGGKVTVEQIDAAEGDEFAQDNLYLAKGQFHTPGLRLGDMRTAGLVAYMVEKGEATLEEWNTWVELTQNENRFSDKNAPIIPPTPPEPIASAEPPAPTKPAPKGMSVEESKAYLAERGKNTILGRPVEDIMAMQQGTYVPRKIPVSKMDLKNADAAELFADDGGFKLGQQDTTDGAKVTAERQAKEDAKAAQDKAQLDMFGSPEEPTPSPLEPTPAAPEPTGKVIPLTAKQEEVITRAQKGSLIDRRKVGDEMLGFTVHRLPDDPTAYAVKNPKDGIQDPILVKLSTEGIPEKTTADEGRILLQKFKDNEPELETPAAPIEPAAPAAAAEPITNVASLQAFNQRLSEGNATADEVKAAWETYKQIEPQIHKEVAKMTMKDLSVFQGMRKPDNKAEAVRTAMHSFEIRFTPTGGLSYGGMMGSLDKMENSRRKAMEEAVAQWTDEIIQANAQERRDAIGAHKKAITDPETSDEWRQFVRRKGLTNLTPDELTDWNATKQYGLEAKIMVRGESRLTPEELAAYDNVRGIDRKAQAEARSERDATVRGVNANTASEIVQTKHTKTGIDLFVVVMAERVERDVYNSLNAAAKRLGGNYSSYKIGGAVPGFQFKDRASAEQFQALTKGETVDRTEAVQERRAEKKNAAAERLSATADRMDESADEALSRDRKTNTVKRAGEASNAEANARGVKAMAETMRNLANAIESGDATHLNGVTSKTHVEALESIATAAQRAAWEKENLSYLDKQRRQGETATPEQMDNAVYPYPYFDRSSILRLVEAGRNENGLKRLSDRVAKIHLSKPFEHSEGGNLTNESDIEDVRKLAKHVDRSWNYTKAKFERYDRLQVMGLTDMPMLRAALREFLQFRGDKAKADPIKEMERALVGMKIPGFFPTPSPMIDQMLDELGDLTGKRLLEPSAGKGDIVDGAKAAGANVDAIEQFSRLRDILKAKGANIIGDDFMQVEPSEDYDAIAMNPPFEDGQDGDHVQHAFKFLKPGGKLVAITGEGIFGRSDKKSQAFRDWLESVGGTNEKMPEGSFKSAFRPTGVATRMVVIEKPSRPMFSIGIPRVVRDAEYLALAKDPEKNREALQKMVDQAAAAAGWVGDLMYHTATSNEPFTEFKYAALTGGEDRYRVGGHKAALTFTLEGLGAGWFTSNGSQFSGWRNSDSSNVVRAKVNLKNPVTIQADPFVQREFVGKKKELANIRASIKGVQNREVYMLQPEFKRLREREKELAREVDFSTFYEDQVLKLSEQLNETYTKKGIKDIEKKIKSLAERTGSRDEILKRRRELKYADPFYGLMSLSETAQQEYPDLIPGAAVRAALKAQGYDGIILQGTNADTAMGDTTLATWVIPFDEGSTIKSADPVTYHDGEIIPLSQRFDPDSDNILFSIGKPSEVFNPSLKDAPNAYEYTTDTRLNTRDAESLASVAKHFGGVTPRANHSETLRTLTRDFSENTGIEVRSFVLPSKGEEFEGHAGFVIPERPGIIWVNSESRHIPISNLLPHEWMHSLSYDPARAALKDRFDTAIGDYLNQDFVEDYKTQLLGRYQPDEVHAEMLGDLFSDAVNPSPFFKTHLLATDWPAIQKLAAQLWKDANPLSPTGLKDATDDELTGPRFSKQAAPDIDWTKFGKDAALFKGIHDDYMAGLTPEEIAAKRGVSEAAARNITATLRKMTGDAPTERDIRYANTHSAAAKIPLSPDPVGKFGRPVSAPQVIESISNVLRSIGSNTPLRVGNLRSPRALGEYYTREGVARIRTANDIPTAAHELGHAMQKALFGHDPKAFELAGASPVAIAELVKMGNAIYPNSMPNGGHISEGFAEWSSVLTYGSDTLAQAAAPEFYKFYKTQVEAKNPKLAKSTKAAQVAGATWRNQGDYLRSKHSIAMLPGRISEAVEGAKKIIKNAPADWVDSGFPIAQFVAEAVEKGGKPILKMDDPYHTFTGLRMVHDARAEEMVEYNMIDFAGNPIGKGLNDIMKPVRGKRMDFLIYLWAKRAEALLKDPMGARNPGMPLETAIHMVKDLETPEFIQVAKEVYKWNDQVLDYAAESSSDFAATVRKIRARDPGYYIPLFREFETFDGVARMGGSAASGKFINQLRGSGRRMKEPFGGMIAQAASIVKKAHQKRILDQIFKIADTVPDLGHLVIEVPRTMLPAASREMGDLVDEINRRLDKAGTEKIKLTPEQEAMMGEILTFFTPAYKPSKQGEHPIMPVFRNGKIHWYQMDGELYNTLASIEGYRLPYALDMTLGLTNRTFRMGTTGLRASFQLVTNPARDLSVLHYNSLASAMPGELFVTWLAEMTKAFAYATTGGKFRAESIAVFERLGGKMSTTLGQDTRPNERASRRLFESTGWRIVDVRNWADVIRDVLQFPEIASRVTEMRLIGKNLGWKPGDQMTEDIAMQMLVAAKQVTTDFTASGGTGRKLNQVIPFFNASIQGKRAHIRSFNARPLRFLAVGLSHAVAALIFWWYNKDEPWWKELSTKMKFTHTYIPFEHDGKKELIRIPRAFEADGLFMGGSEALADAWYQKDPEGAKKWFTEWMKQLIPPVMPAVGNVILEQAANETFYTGRPIVPRSMDGLAPEEQIGPYTTRVAEKLGEIAKISPLRIDHAIRGIFGGAGGDLAALFGTPKEVKREKELVDIPVIGTLFSRGGQSVPNSESITQLYDTIDEANQIAKSTRSVESNTQRNLRLLLEDAQQATAALSQVQKMEFATNDRRALDDLKNEIASDAVRKYREQDPNRGPSHFARGQAERELGKKLRFRDNPRLTLPR